MTVRIVLRLMPFIGQAFADNVVWIKSALD